MSMASPEIEPSPGARPRNWTLRRTLGLVLLVGVMLGVAAGAWWWTHPRAFMSGAGAEMKLSAVPLDDLPFYVGFANAGASRDPETVTLRSVRVRLRDNTAGATATVAVCTRRPVADGTLAFGSGTAATTPDLGKYCTSLQPVRPGVTMRLDDGRQYLIATISVSRPGRAVFANADLTYSRDASHLYQRGTQHIEVGTITTVRVSD
ncbi:MAG TPA: hypothetical protein VFX52_08970 [Nocardioidaceae bacterium]|nr:hypothetical protein [Nocardioidaceae bacterium]